jgi:small-conductance mechanosensitive channel
MAFESLKMALTDAFSSLLVGVVAFIPKLIVAIVVVILGWVIGAALSKIINQLFKTLRIDSALEAAGAKQLVHKAGFNLNSGLFVGELIKYFVVVVSIMATFSILGLNDVNMFLQGIVLGYLPQVIVAVLILVVAIVLSEVMRKVVVGAAKAAGVHKAGLLGSMTKWSIWVFAILAALFQLNIAATFIQTLFTGIVVAFSVALGLAFGLGAKDTAKEIVEDIRAEIRR